MLAYLIRRIFYIIPILIGVNLITFVLFFIVNSPDDIARARLGNKYVTTASIEQWKRAHGYDKPLFFNNEQSGLGKISDTLFVHKSLRLFTFNFGSSDAGRNIGYDISQRMWPSLAIAVPELILGVLISITSALLIVFFRGTYVEFTGVMFCIILMSISSLFFIISGQYVIGKVLQLVPISGYTGGLMAIRFVILPIVIGVAYSLGSSTRWYRTIFLEELGKDYIRTARAKGLPERLVMFKHLLKNAMIPIATNVVALIPLLFMGSLLLESFFGIPGLGSYTIDAIQQQDFAIVRVMVFIGTIAYCVGLILTDIIYTIVDPRIRL